MKPEEEYIQRNQQGIWMKLGQKPLNFSLSRNMPIHISLSSHMLEVSSTQSEVICMPWGYGGYCGYGNVYGGYGSTFVLIVVLFILLIIVGASFC